MKGDLVYLTQILERIERLEVVRENGEAGALETDRRHSRRFDP